MKNYLFCTLVGAALFCACNKEKAAKLIEVDDVCAMIEDANFKTYCYQKFDINLDNKVSMDEALSVRIIDLLGGPGDEGKVSSMKGIEYFLNLERLIIWGHNLSSLDLSNNMELVELTIPFGKLVSLNISKNAKLQSLNCQHNKLTSLDVSNNVNLTELYCGNNMLISLDVSKNTVLLGLICDYNYLDYLDLTSNKSLEFCWINPQNNGNITPIGWIEQGD